MKKIYAFCRKCIKVTVHRPTKSGIKCAICGKTREKEER
jgi:hypothetical protein